MFDINEVKDLVLKSPIKEIRGKFRFNLAIDNWNFGGKSETYGEQLYFLENFLKQEKPWAVFETEKGEELGQFVIEYKLFDGDPPDSPNKKELFFALPLGNNESMLLSLLIKEDWPYYNGGGKFSISLNLD